MDDGIGVEVGQSECYIMTDVYLGVVRDCSSGSFQESC